MYSISSNTLDRSKNRDCSINCSIYILCYLRTWLGIKQRIPFLLRFWMVLILDGNSEHVAHVWRKEKRLTLHFNFCRSKQIPCTIKWHISIYTCSLISGLPSEISTTERNSSVLGENVIHIPTYSLSPGLTVFFLLLSNAAFYRNVYDIQNICIRFRISVLFFRFVP